MPRHRMRIDPAEVQTFIESVTNPDTGKKLGVGGEKIDVQCQEQSLLVTVTLGYPAKSEIPSLTERILAALPTSLRGLASVQFRQDIRAHKVQPLLRVLPGVKNIIAVASGKGGVGKSTVAANVALALSAEGARVGVLDADIYGPSQPIMLGATGQPGSSDGKHMDPILSHGLQINSIGFMLDADQPVIWRGPMVSSALQQLLTLTHWDDLDYLVIDMPPGTGDIQLTLSQQVPVTGAIIVTTPQDIATQDARKGLMMFSKVNIPVLGLVENMALFRCPHCGHLEYVFGQGGADRMASEYNTPVLGRLPLDPDIRRQADSGHPTVIAAPESETAEIYRSIARKATAALALQPRDFSAKIPGVKSV